MSKSPYKREPTGGVFGILGARKKTYKEGPHYEAATRNPAYCKISGEGMSLPDTSDTFDSIYMPSIKPKPILTDVALRHGGDFGLILELEATIQCHTLDDFKRVEKAFLFPGTKVTVEFGYARPWPKSGYQNGNTIKGFKVATYGFNTTEEGFWIAKFKAVAPAIALNDVNMGVSFEPYGRVYKGKSKDGKVSGIAHLIAYDAQINGSVSVDEMADGEVVIPTTHAPAEPGALVIYHPDHLYSNFVSQWWNTLGSGNEVSETDNIVYVTLEYIVNRLINNELLDQYRKSIPDSDFAKCKIKFDPELSYSYTDIMMRSAYPTQILFLGKGRGNYENVDGKGKDFEDCTNLSKLESVGVEAGRIKLNLKNILINRNTVLQALEDSYVEKKTAETNDVKETTEGVINIKTFLMKVFNEISKASGGMVKLRLANHPDIHKSGQPESKAYELYIFDENNGYNPAPMQCWVFDPINGDGSTRNCSITSDVGSKDYQGYMFAAQNKKSDPIHEVEKVNNGNTPNRASERDKAVVKIREIVSNPGSLADNQFSSDEMQALEQAMGTLRRGAPQGKKFDMLVYVGLGIDIEIDGAYGFLPGNAVFSTQMPKRYRDAMSYFFVESVEHIFTGNTSDWVTKIRGKLAFHHSVSYLGA